MKKWEYLELRDSDQNHLNSLGSDGWELVSVVAGHKDFFYYLKREIIEDEPAPSDIRREP